MSILASELILLKSETVSDAGTNGGKMDNTAPVTSGVINNVWPSVFKAERDAGSTKYRKLFYKIANDDDLTLFSPQLWLDIVTPADDWMTMFAGTQIDVQSGITGVEDNYGCASLESNVSSGTSTIIVVVEDESLRPVGATPIFRSGDTIRITDKANPSAVGNEEFHVITGTPSAVGNVLTITIVGTLTNGYASASSRVMSVYEPSDISPIYDSFAETSAGNGTFDEVNGFLVDSIGTIEESYTLTFTASSSFDVIDSDSNAIGSGTTASNFSPINTDVTKPFFTLMSTGWAGTWATGDTITFSTHPASISIWQRRVIPVNCSSLTGDRTTVVLTGESI